MEAYASLRYVIELDPKPEDVGTFKVYASILMPGNFDEPTPKLLFSLQNNQSFSDCASGLREIKDLLNEAGLTNRYADYAQSQFTSHLSSLFSSRHCTDASRVYLRVKVTHSQIHEVMQASFDEATNDIRCIPASKAVVGSLSRKVYNAEGKVISPDSTSRCTICLEEFKNGGRLVILPCGHAFDERCIVDWFETSHVCPLCRFELPCEDMN